MKKLFALLFIAGVIASCGSPVTTQETPASDTATVSMDSTCVDSCMTVEQSTAVVDSVK